MKIDDIGVALCVRNAGKSSIMEAGAQATSRERLGLDGEAKSSTLNFG
jgi:hypothetical protein